LTLSTNALMQTIKSQELHHQLILASIRLCNRIQAVVMLQLALFYIPFVVAAPSNHSNANIHALTLGKYLGKHIISSI